MRPTPGARQRRLGQNFLADPQLLDAIVRDSGVGAGDVVLEIGGGGGALTERLAPAVERLHVIELDERLRPEFDPLAAEFGNVELHWGDAMRLDLARLDPAPSALVSNLPYSVATPLLLKTIAELPAVASWTVMVQLEAAERLAARPSTRAYGSPSVIAQLACEVELVRRVDPAVFVPRPRVASAVLRMRRLGPGPSPSVNALVRAAFAHRRKSLARSLDLAGTLDGVDRETARAALREAGLREDARAEALAPEDFARFAAKLGIEDR